MDNIVKQSLNTFQNQGENHMMTNNIYFYIRLLQKICFKIHYENQTIPDSGKVQRTNQ